MCEDVLVGDVESMELPFAPASFDVVLCGDLVEHLRDPGATLARLRAFLRPAGRLVLTTPNVANWAMRLSLLVGRWTYTDRGILDRTHTHLFTRKTLVETIEGAGYRVLEAGTGMDALEMALAEAPDVVVLDIQLPDISGMEVWGL